MHGFQILIIKIAEENICYTESYVCKINTSFYTNLIEYMEKGEKTPNTCI